MRIDIGEECFAYTISVFKAIGSFIAVDDGPSVLLGVDVFQNEGHAIGLVADWDIHPTERQIKLFRSVLNSQSCFSQTTVIHDAPSSILDEPRAVAAK